MTTKVAAFLDGDLVKDPPFHKEQYCTSYQELTAEIARQGGELFIVRNNSTYQGKGQFSRSWQWQAGQLQDTGPVGIDVVYDKGRFEAEDIPVLNTKAFNHLCNADKYESYKLFPEFFIPSFRVEDKTELKEVLSQLTEEKKVIKPLDGSGGQGVIIDTAENLLAQEHTFPLMVQRFVDTAAGVPGVCEGRHDVRVVMIENQPQYASLRIPAEGSLLANTAQGGTLQLVDLEKLPDNIWPIVEAVDKKLKSYGPRVYSIDFLFNAEGEPRVVELNSRVGLARNTYGEVLIGFKANLASLLLSLAPNPLIP